mmetsp:Transcript_5313/g.21730  ORF Transcript_5313/g.21730 Transcript_5313/m.21730 type:complete len:206 (-) Transcript_5313:986-1603(-)
MDAAHGGAHDERRRTTEGERRRQTDGRAGTTRGPGHHAGTPGRRRGPVRSKRRRELSLAPGGDVRRVRARGGAPAPVLRPGRVALAEEHARHVGGDGGAPRRAKLWRRRRPHRRRRWMRGGRARGARGGPAGVQVGGGGGRGGRGEQRGDRAHRRLRGGGVFGDAVGGAGVRFRQVRRVAVDVRIRRLTERTERRGRIRDERRCR